MICQSWRAEESGVSLLGLGCACAPRLLLKYSFLWKGKLSSAVIPNQSPLEDLSGGGETISRVSAGCGVRLRICLANEFLISLAAGPRATLREPLVWCCVIQFNKMYKGSSVFSKVKENPVMDSPLASTRSLVAKTASKRSHKIYKSRTYKVLEQPSPILKLSKASIFCLKTTYVFAGVCVPRKPGAFLLVSLP